MIGYADAIGDVFVAGPIHRKAIIKALLLEVIIDRIHIQTAIAHLAGPQILKHRLGICVKSLGILMI